MKSTKAGITLLSLSLGLALSFSQAYAYKICIDPGHGGSDPGATGGGYEEADLVLATSTDFKDWMELDTADTGGGGSWTVIRTRSTDTYVSLSGRTTYANNNSADRFMSIHNNAFNSSAHGIETFCYTYGSSNSFDLRNKVYSEATSMWPLTQRGTKTASFYVIKYTNMPAELHEMAFIDSSVDRVYLTSSTHRDNHAKSELWAIQQHMGYSKYTPSAQAIVVTDNGDAGFTPGSGWWASTSTAGYYGSNYHVRATQATSAASTWSFTLPRSGSYKVEAWWTAGANRSATAPYIVYHSGGSTTVSKNQQTSGGVWNNLGTFSFNSGSNSVKLSCWTSTGYYVVADAVRLSEQ
jgi:N-acetylmuramoyl-L-alanine amidase